MTMEKHDKKKSNANIFYKKCKSQIVVTLQNKRKECWELTQPFYNYEDRRTFHSEKKIRIRLPRFFGPKIQSEITEDF